MLKKIFYDELTFKNFIKAPNPDSESETLVEAEPVDMRIRYLLYMPQFVPCIVKR